MRLEGKVAIVAGAAWGGIGAAHGACAFAQEGRQGSWSPRGPARTSSPRRSSGSRRPADRPCR